MKRSLRRAVSLLCVLEMCLSLLPTTALAESGLSGAAETQAEKQINGLYYAYNEQTKQFETEGDTSPTVTNRTDDPNVTISKTITPTGVENQFDITLKVETDEAIEVSTKQPDAAIVLVIDVSYSMEYCAECGKSKSHDDDCQYYKKNGYNVITNEQTRLYAAQEAAKEFLEAYAGFENGTGH